jgi:multiple antibiotic resistance protein
MKVDLNYYVQAIVAVVLLTDPVIRPFLFKGMTANEPQKRPAYVRTIMAVVGVTLGISALAGREILDAIGINLDAFGVAGGIVLSLMGFEMLLGGEPSRAQGGKEAHEEPESFEGKVVVPYAIPFVAGPGAITAVITIAASGSSGEGRLAALVAVGVAVLLMPVGYLVLAQRINLSEQAMTLITKFGGLFVATIGIQLVLSGLQNYFNG